MTNAPIAAAARVPSADAAPRPSRRRTLRIGLGVLGAAVLSGVILMTALGSSRGEARRDPRSARPAAADLVHAVSEPPPPAAEVASPRAVAPSPAGRSPSSPAAAPPAKPATAAAAEPALANPATPAARTERALARPAAGGDSPAPARSSAPREPARAAKPASPPRAAPARPLSYDPDALFLPKQ
jgi:hypothetical protein